MPKLELEVKKKEVTDERTESKSKSKAMSKASEPATPKSIKSPKSPALKRQTNVQSPLKRGMFKKEETKAGGGSDLRNFKDK